MIKKGSKSYSIFYNKCPKCQSGRFWYKNNPYLNIFKDNKLTNSQCDRCNFKYEIEPGFWFGAMYVSYGISVAFLMIFGASLLSVFGNIELLTIVSVLSVFVVILAPVNHFFSRLIWINIFVDYKNPNK
ncbi:DUF983 domain-containing protein [Flavobacteriaceae bacterium]|nr:DUF983 domain-containing protein [Flavobacteriaceae bacterium]